MQLRCSVCAAVQAVTMADDADEDARTQAIRRAFRADHVERCGERSVSLELGELAPVVDTSAWDRYLAQVQPPAGVRCDGAGVFTRDGWAVCEDCWQQMPPYIDFPLGLTSPESTGDDDGRAAKVRGAVVEGKAGVEHLQKVVCLPCYLAAFWRVYPGAERPAMRADVLRTTAPYVDPTPAIDGGSVGDPLPKLVAV